MTRAALSPAVLLLADVAHASQGPGGGMGTASQLTQLLMAVIVYGTSGMVIAAGLIGAARGR
ncbi:hypothetical protein UP09_18250 [Bradyrhizobium sp. LTSP885]|nr:hypothetical protein UP09_18250 [Bradyrhizobium sp. LTSP885]